MRLSIFAISLLCLAMFSCESLELFNLVRSYEITLADSSPLDTTVTNVTANRDSSGQPATLLSAFYGVDDGLPKVGNQVMCEGAAGKDGMPVIFSHEIDVSTMEAGDFKVITASGKIGEITCVTLAPADDKGEFRTALLIGQYGSIDDQPVKVEIIGNLLSKDNTFNFKGASVDVIPLEDGPTMILAKSVPENEWDVGKAATPLPWGGGSGCPEGTRQVVRVTWAGGITKPGGDEVDDAERLKYKVTLLQEDGSTVEVTPFALADLGDGDNNHRLCLDMVGKPQAVSFPAGFLTDPREDLNPKTTINITQ